MCQGVVVSLVKFQNEQGKNKKVVLKGIGSHSNLINDNQNRLKKLGWTESAKNQEVISIESDFSAWNKYTIENGVPTKSERAILTRAYKDCAGNARALILHVKKIGKIDDALINLLTNQARAEYEKVTNPARAEYEKVTNQAWAEYEKVKNQARAEYEKVTNPAWAEYEKVKNPARAEYEKVKNQTWAEYEKVTNPARAEYEKVKNQTWAEYEKVTNPARAEYEKVTNQAWAEYEKVKNPAWAEYEKVKNQAWLKLFSKKENRVERLR